MLRGSHKLLRMGTIRSSAACCGLQSAAGHSLRNGAMIFDFAITRMGFWRVDAELEVELGGGSFGALAENRGGGGRRSRAEQAPAGQFRCFHYCFSPRRRLPRL